MRFDGKAAIITGAASPIGKAIVDRLAGGGAKLVMADVDDEALTQAIAGHAPGAFPFVGDLSDQETAEQLVGAARKEFGRVDILINNAGGGVISETKDHTPDTVRRTVDRNLWTAIWCTLPVLPMMVEQNYGRIVNIGADSVRNGLWMHAVYNAAKGGVHAMVTGIAREYAQYDITANVVAPSMVETPLVSEERRKGNPWVAKMESVIPKGRPAFPAEVASMVAYLALDEAAFVTGQVISVNGGSTML
ncbi:SDR family oxidoreductase [Sphingopyxis granuli]|uniref:SDR family NAD(P)-dependent oxidoreductase n=1 Tax=Sphingopyxis granuli TaxID=267128 RepID=UPI001F52E2CC|nr:SDR family oxidoreductase [Sphingopyxis granuli]UNK81075.1 SDR family oxidoreductase [Sphingopyxis granuli]